MRDTPLIVGAGPVGLAAALFLAKRGLPARIIEQETTRTDKSKALAVNPRTMRLLQATGVTDRLLEIGMPFRGAVIHAGEKTIGRLEFTHLATTSSFPFMLGLSQSQTERLLEEALRESGTAVQRGVALRRCENTPDGAVAEVGPADNEHDTERVSCPWLLAADGAHSTVRHQLSLQFPGDAMTRIWHLRDIRLSTTLEPDRIHIFQNKGGGFLFVARVVVDHRTERHGPQIWRVLGDMEDPVSRVPFAEPAGEPTWTSTFHIAHRIVPRFSVGAIHLAGDAAHIHSPLGARGMNLGIEDAWVFAECVARGELHRYHDLRQPVDQSVVRRVRLLTRAMIGEATWSRVLRRIMVPAATRISTAQKAILRTVTGLDHDLPFEVSN